MPAISKADFSKAAGINGLPLLVSIFNELLKIDAFNTMMENAKALKGAAFADHLFKTLGVTLIIDDESLGNIPANGAFITVANPSLWGHRITGFVEYPCEKATRNYVYGQLLVEEST
jgi:hypothetical protein